MTVLLAPVESLIDCGHEGGFVDLDMTEYPRPHYSKKDVVRAGKALKAKIPYVEGDAEAIRIFQIANDWRDSHAYPMRRIRQELGGRIRRLNVCAVTAGRTKRMKSIRKKLAKTSGTLIQMQDLGGCRAIVDGMTGVNALINAYRAGASTHCVRTDTNYIDEPKPGGYRSHHFVLDFQATTEDEIYDGRRIEVQIRTQLQHAWATAVEAVGLTRREDLKGGEGHQLWLRMFALMSAEFADIEGTPTVPGTGTRNERREEIRAINSTLRAADTLANLATAFRAAENWISPSAKFFMIQYDSINETVRVTGYKDPMGGFSGYNQPTPDSIDSVLVEVDKVESLRAAYPNYFGDVQIFTGHMNEVLGKRDHSTWLRTYRKA